jgi:putative acetyltransferase
VKVGPADPRDDGPRSLLEASHSLLDRLFPPGECHFLDLDALRAPDVRFVAATEGAKTLGVGALVLRTGYAEVKSMFTAPEARGRGVARAILMHLMALAEAERRPRLRLETGVGLDAAIRLYERHGFVACGPFGAYEINAMSLFYERPPDDA